MILLFILLIVKFVFLQECDFFLPYDSFNCLEFEEGSFSCFGIDSRNSSVCGGFGNCISQDECCCVEGAELIGTTCRPIIGGASCTDVFGQCGFSLCAGSLNFFCDCSASIISSFIHGLNCEFLICNGTSQNSNLVCSGHGNCVSTIPPSCSCDFGHSGSNCEIFNCTDNCNNHGECIASDLCKCDCNDTLRYTGDLCQTTVFNDECEPGTKCDFDCTGNESCICVVQDGIVQPLCADVSNLNCTIDCPFCNTTQDCPDPEPSPPDLPECFGILSNETNVCSGNGQCVDTDDCGCAECWFGVECSEFNATCDQVPFCDETAGCNFTEVCEDILEWMELFPPESPSNRSGHTMVIDESNGRMYMFGGKDSDGLKNDTWLYNISANSWNQLSPTGGLLTAREQHVMVIDKLNGKMYMFGGSNGGFKNDIWLFSISANSWSQLSPAGTLPSARERHAMVMEESNGRIYMVGGFDGTQLHNDTWLYNISANSWTELFPSGGLLTTRFDHTMVIDELNGNIYVFGGSTFTVILNDIWLYSISDNSWTELFPSGGPPLIRSSHVMVINQLNGNIYMFGGGDAIQTFNDIWLYSISDNSWTELFPSGILPLARFEHTMVIDQSNPPLLPPNIYIFPFNLSITMTCCSLAEGNVPAGES